MRRDVADQSRVLDLISGSGLVLENSKVFRTGKKLTIKQAKEEMAFACDNVPVI